MMDHFKSGEVEEKKICISFYYKGSMSIAMFLRQLRLVQSSKLEQVSMLKSVLMEKTSDIRNSQRYNLTPKLVVFAFFVSLR